MFKASGGLIWPVIMKKISIRKTTLINGIKESSAGVFVRGLVKRMVCPLAPVSA